MERMLYVVGRLLWQQQVFWWASHGTLLGAARHRGPVPGDDDVDLDIMLHGSELLGTEGFKADLHQNGIELAVHSGPSAMSWSMRPLGTHSAENGPHLDICFAILRTNDNETMRYVSYPRFHRGFNWKPGPKSRWRFMRYGSTHVVVPERYDEYLTAMYGSDWNTTVRTGCRLKEYMDG